MLEKYITNYLSKKGHNVDNMVKALQRSRAKYGEKLSYEDALEELVCNTMSEIATDEDVMATFLELNESERKTLISVLRDIANKIREWARSLTGKEYRRLVTESETLRHLANELNKQLKEIEITAEPTADLSKNSRRISETAVTENNISQPEDTVKKKSYADMVDLSADYDNAVEEYLRHKSRDSLNKVREMVNLAASKAMPDSVVKDESGLLTKVYHGTEAENFNVFDRERRGQTDSSLWGRGYYFTPDVEFASDFGENVRGFYLNITNPFIIGKVDAPASVIAVKFKSLGIPVDFDYRGMKAFEFANAFGNQRFTDVLMEKGFDGVIVEDFEYVVFEQNQMKLADAITYDDNGEVIPLSERFDESKTDIRYSRDDFSVDYSDLSILDDEQLDAYNKRGWARDLFTAEDYVLLNQRMGEIFRPNSQYPRITLADGIIVLDLNNKIVLLSGKYGQEVIEGVFVQNAPSEDYAKYIKGAVFREARRKGSYRESCVHFLKTIQRVQEEDDIRFYDAVDYRYNRTYGDDGRRATLPDNWQNYGYTTDKQDGRGVSEGSESGISRTDSLSKKKKYSYADEEVDLWGMLEPEEETAESTQRSEYLEGFVQTAATILEKTRGVTLIKMCFEVNKNRIT